jgi:hypothetical protein
MYLLLASHASDRSAGFAQSLPQRKFLQENFSLTGFDARQDRQADSDSLEVESLNLELSDKTGVAFPSTVRDPAEISLKPRIEVSGVRNSCDMRARNRER